MINVTKLIRLNEALADWVRLEALKNHRSTAAELGLIVQAEQLRRQMNHADVPARPCGCGPCGCIEAVVDQTLMEPPEGGVAESPACP